MDIFIINWLLLMGVFAMALASPGPDFVMIVRNAVLHTRLHGIFTSIGFAAGVAIHTGYTVLGLAALIAQSVAAFTVLKFLGAAYLFYIGIQALRSTGYEATAPDAPQKQRAYTLKKAFLTGFLTNLLNPKATLFFLAVFSQFLTPDMVMVHQGAYALTCILMTFVWFSFVTVVLTDPRIKVAFLRFTKWIDRVCGGLLIALSLKLALTKAV
jgi:RhtB (resistance to homoserine/threonine) family protein